MNYCHRCVLDPLEYNILVKLHTSTIEHRAQSIIRDVRWRQRMLERDEAGFYYTVPVEAETNEVTNSILRVPRICYWRDLVEYPKLITRLYDTYVQAGHNARLEIRATGFPELDVQWYKDWHPINENENFKIEHFEPDVYVLSIYNATIKDQALYSCRIRNIAGSLSTSAMVHVEKEKNPYDWVRESFYDNLFEK